MNKYLPSKKFAKFFGAIVGVIVLVFLISGVFPNEKTFVAKGGEASVTSSDELPSPYEQDSDDDGVFDWEEGLWGTDPYKKDSNDDGVSDLDEISSRRDDIKGEEDTSEDSSDENLNQTELFARQLLSTASLASQQGGLSDASIDNFSKSLSNSIIGFSIPDQYTLADIKMAAVLPGTYKASITKAFQEYLTANISELGLIERLIAGDITAEADADELIKIYGKLSTDLLKVEAPYPVAGTHLAMINSATKLSAVFINLKNVGTDPLAAVAGLKSYQKYSEEIELAATRLTDYFRASGV